MRAAPSGADGAACARHALDAARRDATARHRPAVVWQIFKGLASERAARAKAIERAETQLEERIPALKAAARKGKELTELQQALVAIARPQLSL